MTKLRSLLATAVSVAALAGAAPVQAAPAGAVKNIVLVHGAFADGSGWRTVAEILHRDGYTVSVVQPPMTSLQDDVVATIRILGGLNGPAILVGHSYGGGIITAAGNNPKVVGLVYVAAYAPDVGETMGGLAQSKPAASTGIVASQDGFFFVNPAVFGTDFGADLPQAQADFMALSQMPVSGKGFRTAIAAPAWKTKPSYAIVATEDRMINPDLERTMYARAHAHVTEMKASHAVYISQPGAVAKVIEQAAQDAK